MPDLERAILSPPEFEQQLVRYINEVLPSQRSAAQVWVPVTATTPLFSTGLLDSLSILHLIAAVEELSGRPVPDQMVVMNHFQTVVAMTAAFAAPATNHHP